MWDYANQPVRPPVSISSCLHRINDGAVQLSQTKLEDMTPEQQEWARSMCDKLLAHLYPNTGAAPTTIAFALGTIEAGSDMFGKLVGSCDREGVNRLSKVLDDLHHHWMEVLRAEIRESEREIG